MQDAGKTGILACEKHFSKRDGRLSNPQQIRLETKKAAQQGRLSNSISL